MAGRHQREISRRLREVGPPEARHVHAGHTVPTADATPVRRWLCAAMAALAGLGILLGIRPISSPDIGFHLATARWIVQNAAFPATDAFTYTVSAHAYIDLQWMFQLTMYGLQKLAGPAGITLATTVLTLIFAGGLLLRSWRRNRGIGFETLLLLLLFLLGNGWEPRPHLLSWVFGSAVLLVLEEHRRGNRRWLPALPVVMLLWVNSHSLFVLGLAILGIGVFCEMVDAARRPGSFQPDRRVLGWSGAAALACLINPYHVQAFVLPFTQFFLIQEGAALKSPTTGIAEFTSPFEVSRYVQDGRLVLLQTRLWYQLFTLLAVGGVLWSARRLRLFEWLLLAAFLYVFWKANKNFGYFVMAVFPFAAAGLGQLGRRIKATLASKRPRPERDASAPSGGLARGYPAIVVACLLITLAVITGWWYDMQWTTSRLGFGYDRSILPVGACAFVQREGIEGRWLNTWDDGGFLAWAIDQPIFIYSHGEVSGQAFYRRYIRAKQPEGFAPALERWEPTAALVRFRLTPFWLYELNRRDDWRMAYADDRTAVFLHRTLAPEVPALPDPEAGKDYPRYDMRRVERAVNAAINQGPAGFGQWLRGSAAYPLREMRMSSFYLQTNEVDASIGIALKGLRKAGFLIPDLMLNLGHALNHVGHDRLADRCYDVFLAVSDDPAIRRQIRMMRQQRP